MENSSKPMILAVDDEPTNLRFLMEILRDEYRVYLAPSGERALAFLQNKRPDLILLDVEMPQMNGYEVIQVIKQNPDWRDIPVIFLTGLEGRDNEQAALDLGAVDYILKPISVGVVKARAGLHIELEAYRRKLEDIVEIRTRQLKLTQDVILDMLANMTSYRDNETGAHIKRTTIYSQLIINRLLGLDHPDYQLSGHYAESIIKSAKLHDIGKVAVPDNILLKPSRLTAQEFEMIKLHTLYGAQIIDKAIDELGDSSSFLNVAREIILAHHERWDGTGYPYGLAGDEIPLSARIMAIADVYDALISTRPYKMAFSHDVAIQIILKDAGTHFDPHLVAFCLPEFCIFPDIVQQHKDDTNEIILGIV